MDIKDLGEKIDSIHRDNREDHRQIIQKIETITQRVEGNTREILIRPTFAEAKQIAKEEVGFKNWLATGIGSIIGAVSGFFSACFFGQK